ncbi:hypothetical protein C3L55_03025 [Veillonellaceae bacterium M1-70]|nr:hypothetical protein [Veillonellaceae bacterium M1-70]
MRTQQVSAKMKVIMNRDGKSRTFTMGKLRSGAEAANVYTAAKAVSALQKGDLAAVHMVVDTKIEA